ncbi:MAG: glycosyltransferase [Candidatus Nitrosocosmicus sp.]
MPKLSIITINLNNVEGLQKTIESVCSQTFTDYEYIIIDGGSTDASRYLIKRYENKLVYWVSEIDSGIYNAMNKGILKAKGEYILFLNSGDYLADQNVLWVMLNNKKKNIDLIYGNLLRTFPDGHSDCIRMPASLNCDFMFNKVLCHPVTFIRRKLFCKYGLYDESLQIVSDWAFFLKVVVFYNVKTLYKDVSVSVFSMDGISSKSDNQEIIERERQVVSDNLRREAELKTLNKLKKMLRGAVRVCKRKLKGARAKVLILNKFRLTIFQLLFPKKIPIIINSFNRLECLKKLIERLTAMGYSNIIILDNNSTYPPLLEYYATLTHKIIFLKKNYGHTALWESNIIKNFKHGYFVYTDPDILPVETCPDNFISYFLKLLLKYPAYKKVGFGLVITDLPENYPLKQKVIRWESQFWEKQIEKGVFIAQIDTTFALYSPNFTSNIYTKEFYSSLRTGGKYLARHLTWYASPEVKTNEEIFYEQSANYSASWIIDPLNRY